MRARLHLRHYTREVDSHRHDHHQLVFPCTGTLDMEIDGRGGRVSHGCAAFIASGERHAFQAHGANAFVVLDLPAAGLGRDGGALPPSRFPAMPPQAQRLLAGLGATMPQQPQAIATWSSLLLHALRDADSFDGLAAAHALLETDPVRDHDLRWLVRLSGGSRAQFYRRFGARYGIAPAAVRREARLRQALEQLRDSNQSITHIASNVGYSEHSALTRALRRCHGCPPRTLRARAASASTACPQSCPPRTLRAR